MAEKPIYTAEDGRELRLADLVDTSGEASANTTNIPEPAIELFNEGIEFGRNNDLEGALEKFSAATELAPEWPYPIFHAAFTHVMTGNTEAALSLYCRVDELEPRGFFTTKTAIAVLEKELNETYPRRALCLSGQSRVGRK
jgi:tetratricopeptide (TPR) repeat protein